MMSMSKILNDLLSTNPLMFRSNVVLQSELSGITHCAQPSACISTYVFARSVVDDWDFMDDRELQSRKGACSCMTCQHFSYGVDQHCRTLLGCNMRQRQLVQGDHLTKSCKLWAPTWQKQVGWAPEAG